MDDGCIQLSVGTLEKLRATEANDTFWEMTCEAGVVGTSCTRKVEATYQLQASRFRIYARHNISAHLRMLIWFCFFFFFFIMLFLGLVPSPNTTGTHFGEDQFKNIRHV